MIWNAIIDFLFDLIGLNRKKPDEKVGSLTVENSDLTAANKALKHELEIKDRPAGTDDDVIDRL